MERKQVAELLETLSDTEMLPSEYDFSRALVAVADYARVSLATAESLTGGSISSLITMTPGSSKVFRGGVVAYQSPIKIDVLGVRAELVQRVGVIHPDVAVEMAQGVARLMSADIAVGITGVAGPDTQDGASVGTVHLAVVDVKRGQTRVASQRFDGSRGEIRQLSVLAALGMLLDASLAHTDLQR